MRMKLSIPALPKVSLTSLVGAGPGSVEDWKVVDVQAFLDRIELPQLKESFHGSSVDGPILLSLTDEDLRDTLGVSNGLLRRKCVLSISKLQVKLATPRPLRLVNDTPRCTDIFVSYSHADQIMVDRCVGRLNAAGLTTWVDSRGIAAGTVWRQQIAQGIDMATCVVYFMSGKAVTSQYCLEEVHYAVDAKKPFFPVMIEDHFDHVPRVRPNSPNLDPNWRIVSIKWREP